NVVPHGSNLTQAVIDRSHRGPQRSSKLTLKTQFFSELSLYEVAFDVGQSRVEELAISPHIGLAGPPRMTWYARRLHRPMPPRRCAPADEALRFVGSNAVKLAKTRQPHGQSPAWRRIDVIVQLLQRRQNVVETEAVRDT